MIDSFTVVTTLTRADMAAFAADAAPLRPRRMLSLFAVILLVTGAIWLADATGMAFDAKSLLFGIVAALLYIVAVRRLSGVLADDPDLNAMTLEFNPDGVRTTRPGMTSMSSWSSVGRITFSRSHFFIWLSRGQGLIVPLRDLPDSVTAESARKMIESWTNGSVPLNKRDRPDDAIKAPATTVAQSAANDPAADEFAAKVLSARIGALVAGSLATWFLIDWLLADPNAEFVYRHLPIVTWHTFAVLSLAYVFARASVPAMPLRRSLFVVLIATPFVILGLALVDRIDGSRWQALALAAGAAVVALYLVRSSRAVTGSFQMGSAIAAVVGLSLWYLANQYLEIRSTLWHTPADTQSPQEANAAMRDNEQTLFDQRSRIEEAVDAVEPAHGDVAAFFVGFAGDADEEVFADEIDLAAKQFAKRYGTEKRSIQLANDARSRAQPIATVTGLHYALNRLAPKMNLERDVLVLALSSNCSSTHGFYVSNAGMPISDLAGNDIRSALDDAGIRWRVIVMSGCYPGPFIDQLADDQTLVIGWSSPYDESHDENRVRHTRFGEAFYKDALPRAASIREAYDITRKTIAAR